MEEKCYIVCDSVKMTFAVLGHRPKQVRQALIRLRAAYFQVVARMAEMETHYFVGPQTEQSRSVIRLSPWETSTESGKIPKMRPMEDQDSKRMGTDIVDPDLVLSKVRQDTSN